MAIIDPNSRYASLSPYPTADRLGRAVLVLPVPEAPIQALLGYHLRLDGQRLDHLAAYYDDDPCGFWRVAEQNDVLLPEALTQAREIAIPGRSR
jgi:hypothetical protein